jgi:hypothetical protein
LVRDRNWRDNELSLIQVCEKYPDVSPFVIIKTDVQRRGVIYTEDALRQVDPVIHLTNVRSDFYDKEDLTPVSLLMRDGTSIFCEGILAESIREPYVVDAVDGKIVLVDGGLPIEEVSYWEKPDYYDKETSSGVPMWHVVSARPQRITIHPNQFCDYWKTSGNGCKFCVMAANFKAGNKPSLLNVKDIIETVSEAVKEPGRNVCVFLTGGTLMGGAEFLDAEVGLYIDILSGISDLFGEKRFPSQLVSTIFSQSQLARLYENTGLSTYTADIEVLNKELFNWICPGKAKTIGYDAWKEKLYRAVDIFGPGNVNTGIVAGVELATPNGFKTEDEALESVLSEAEEISSHGVGVVSCVWRVLKGTVFFRQTAPSLEYYVRLARGLDAIRRKYNINVDMDNYRRCGNHPDTDTGRI